MICISADCTGCSFMYSTDTISDKQKTNDWVPAVVMINLCHKVGVFSLCSLVSENLLMQSRRKNFSEFGRFCELYRKELLSFSNRKTTLLGSGAQATTTMYFLHRIT